MKIAHFTDLEVWKEAHKLTLLIYGITKNFPSTEIYGLTSQIRRASVSIESCIAEGFYRFHYKDRVNFYYDARGSVGEVQSQIIDSKDLKFCNETNFQKIWQQSEKVRVLLQGLINSTNYLSRR
ncbi:four helix bundle protein [Candidatus Gottesmanbacteria bacterium]|nr:four helix bundle protein [Candidatus Gottesmanbacteria bacterium]